jgi:hypothetical protein
MELNVFKEMKENAFYCLVVFSYIKVKCGHRLRNLGIK